MPDPAWHVSRGPGGARRDHMHYSASFILNRVAQATVVQPDDTVDTVNGSGLKILLVRATY
jgi:hypothetical protein